MKGKQLVRKLIIIFSLMFQPCFAFQTHQNVAFGFDQDGVDDSIINLSGNPNESSVFWIKGFADPTGDEAYNMDLSIRRAANVKRALMRKYSLKDSQVKITYYGEDLRSGVPNYKKRRVEIVSGTASEISKLMNEPEVDYVAKKEFKKAIEPYSYKAPEENSYNASAVEEEPSVQKAALYSYSEPQEPTDAQIKSAALEENSNEENYVEKRAVSGSDFKKEYKDRYYFGFGVYHNILLATDRGTGSEAEWVSGENYNLEAQYQFKYKNFWLGVRGSYHVQDYEVELNPTFTWDEKTPSLLKLSLVSDYEKGRLGLGFDLDFNQVPFVYEENFDVELRDVFMLGVSLRAKYKWLETQRYSSRLGIHLSYPLSGSDDIDPKGKFGYVGFIDLKRDKTFWNYGLNVKLYYGFRNYTNNQNDQAEEVAGILFSLTSFNWL